MSDTGFHKLHRFFAPVAEVGLELTLVQWLWCFNFNYHDSMGALVIWALGWSMVALSGLVFLPLPVITGFGVSLILFHNLFDAVRPESFGAWRWLWMVLHQHGILEPLPGVHFIVLYPLIPWIGVMAAGHGFGQLLVLEPRRRRHFLRWMGAGLILAFLILRAWNQYGDKRQWSSQSNGLLTGLSFLNCSKYPPSLLFLLMTLGPAILFLSWVERALKAAGWLASDECLSSTTCFTSFSFMRWRYCSLPSGTARWLSCFKQA